jgi:competence protein ComEC
MTPLLAATLAYCAGLLAGFRQPLPLPVLALLALAAVSLLAVRQRHTLVAALLCAGIASGVLRAAAARTDCRQQLRDGAVVHVAGSPHALPTEGMTLLLAAQRLRADGIACDDVAVRVRASPRHHALLEDAARGRADGVSLRGRWMAHAPRNAWPRQPVYAGMLLIDSIAPATLPRPSLLTRLRVSQQARLRALLPERWGLAEAMLLAQKSGLSPDTRATWVAAGLVHLLAISGMHVGMIAAGVIALAAALGLPRRRGRRVAIAVTAAYVVFLGAPAAALRALLQACMLLASLELQRPAEPFTALAAAALGILLLDPLALLDPGFQLSFAGMIGLVAWRRPLADLLPPRLPDFVRDGIAAGVAASALTTPVAALHFGTASWIGIPATLLAAPALAVCVALVVAMLVIATISMAAAALVAVPTDLALRLLDGIAAGAAAVPGGHGYLAAPTVLYALIACAAALLLRARLRDVPPPATRTGQPRRRAALLRGAAAAAAAMALLSWAPLLLRSHADTLEIHVIDVGQGDAIAVRTPAGRWLLVDTGPRSARFDAGRDRVVPYLLGRGARRIEALVLTHPDADHIGGAEAVLEVFDVGVIVDPGFAAGKDMFIDLLATARRAGRRWVAARADIAFAVDDVEVALLYPLPSLDGARDANDNSVVFRLRFGEFAALFTGDAPMAVEDTLVALHGSALRAAVLKVGHHGSRTSTGELLLDAVTPDLALVSAGRNNRYGHPNAGVLQRLEAHGVRVLRTDRSGSFIVRARRDGATEVLAR